MLTCGNGMGCSGPESARAATSPKRLAKITREATTASPVRDRTTRLAGDFHFDATGASRC
jgi:hypothetical protein